MLGMIPVTSGLQATVSIWFND